MAKYIIRFDDLYVGMERNNLYKVRDIIAESFIPAIVGVVPNWQDELHVGDPIGELEFWQTIRLLQENGCEVALHGYSHKLFEHDNLLGVNSYGEFSGLSFDEQNKKIKDGLAILEKNGVFSRMFMAPAHSFDENTLTALKESKVSLITDGKSFYPYVYRDILFCPQISSKLNPYPFGIITICFHPQWMNNDSYTELKNFCKLHSDSLVDVQYCIDYFNGMNPLVKIVDQGIRHCYFWIQGIKNIAQKKFR